MPAKFFADRPKDVAIKLKTAVPEYLSGQPELEIGQGARNRLIVTVAPDGF